MTTIQILDGMPYVVATLVHHGSSLTLDHVLLDTGSITSVFRSDLVKPIGLTLEKSDPIRFMRGVGGREAVIEKRVDSISVGPHTLQNYTMQLGGLNYGMPLDGILGLDFLLAVGATLDLKTLDIRRHHKFSEDLAPHNNLQFLQRNPLPSRIGE